MNTLPIVSVVIPMRNEAVHIDRCLDSVLAQEYPPERLEVIVVDGESDDDSLRVLAGYGSRIRVLTNPSRIVPGAMNIGIRAAHGEIICRVDAHTVLDPDFVRIGVETLQRTGADNVGGPMVSVGGGRWGDAIALAMSSRFGIGSYFHFASADREVDTVYMGMFPKRVFERIGLFDEELVRDQDDELNYRLRKSGGRIFLTMRMRSRYQNRQSVRALARQFFQYGWWKIRVLQKHPKQMSLRQFVPALFILSLLGSAIVSLFCPPAVLLLLVALVAYGAAASAAAAVVAQRNGWSLFVPLLATFATMHFSYGSGFLLAIFRFADRWFASEPSPPPLNASAATDGARERGQ
ncbi:MAG: glycosyltransferase family 2 protein [Deltaproteobacteria bacterium]|nr:glycosyltransferase family 2 protein [Deltaproteobacteria bacterium]